MIERTRPLGEADAHQLRRTARRLSLQIAVVMAAVVAIVGATAFGLVAASLSRATDQELTSVRDDARGDELGAGTYVIREHEGTFTAAEDLPTGLPDEDALDRVQAGEQRVDTRVEADGHRYVVRTSRGEGEIVQVAIDTRGNREQLQRVGAALGIGGIAGVVVAALVADRLARRAMRPLADALARQRRFVADAGHELRTPLTLLSTRVQILRRRRERESDPEATDREIAAIQQDAASLTALLEELLEAADDREVELEDVDLRALAEAALDSAGAEAERAGVELRLAGDSAVHVRATTVGVRRIVQSLLANALDHTRSRVELHVSTGPRGGVLRIADDGPGFPAGDAVFERFASQRSGEASRHHYGLGLSLVADVVRRLEGEVRIDRSAPGGVIEVTLPPAP
ncbi:hypothetical protein GCM10009592_19440 [Brachybacterium rhamnosum]|uniref:histidine kinase n=1 Tax=Brachybacterium rhamnosum TaxID=173361 RepID=A0ABW4PXG0_9MICO|nr:HAMP domain-containing sensor histidine kinase [Brachybacterium sp. SGAir0954]QCR53488.1 sensor histidine kinase [Brachybacterium sp. SGAir0954]